MIETLKQVTRSKTQSELLDEILIQKQKFRKAKKSTRTPEERLKSLKCSILDILRSAWSEDKPRRQIDEPSELQGLVNKRVAKEKAKKADADFGRDFPICLDQEDPCVIQLSDNDSEEIDLISNDNCDKKSELSEIELNITKNISKLNCGAENELMCRSSLSEEGDSDQCKEFSILIDMTETRVLETQIIQNSQNSEASQQKDSETNEEEKCHITLEEAIFKETENVTAENLQKIAAPEIQCAEDPSCLVVVSDNENNNGDDCVSQVDSVVSLSTKNQKSVQKRKRDSDPPENNTQIFFSGPDQRNHRELEQKLQKLLYTAKNKVLICNYIIGNGIMSFEIAKDLKNKCGNNFRIITDQMQMTNKNLKKYCNELVARGVAIKKNNNAKNLMHCKFMTIDDKYLVEGSMNLGEKSLKNYEHITISTNKEIIKQFNKRFESMWNNQDRFSIYTNDDSDESSYNLHTPISVD